MTCQEFPVYENIFKLLFMGKETHYVKTIFCMFRIKSFISITSFLKYFTKRYDNANEALIHNSLVSPYNLVFIVRKLECYCEFCENKNLKKKQALKCEYFLFKTWKSLFLRRSNEYTETTSKMKTVNSELTILQNVCLMKIYKWKMFDNSYDYLTLYFKCYYRT